MHYPSDLARLVASHMEKAYGSSPPESVLVRLFETLYFASLRTEEGRRPLCTVNFADPRDPEAGSPPREAANRWTVIPFETRLPLDIRTLTKLARAADAEVSSLNVFADGAGELFLWGMVDQEPRHGDQVLLRDESDPNRPGLFQVMTTGVGNISVYRNGVLLASLSQDTLVQTYYDVLWSGPVHGVLIGHLHEHIATNCSQLLAECGSPDPAQLEHELLVRWLNSLSRLLVNIQGYRHGGGLIIAPHPRFDNMHVKYRICYDRLVRSVIGMVRTYLIRGQASDALLEASKGGPLDDLYANLSFIRDVHQELEQRRAELLGCVRYIAALSRVDGVVLLDGIMAAHGFGVELRPEANLDEVHLASDAQATAAGLRAVDVTHFGTRHRAMMRYCYQIPGSLGFSVSQDGGIQAMMRIEDKLILWENIDVDLAFNADDYDVTTGSLPAPLLRRFCVRAEI